MRICYTYSGKSKISTSVFILVCLMIVSPSQAATITVDDNGPADFNNIQAAINVCNEGDIVMVSPGRYTGPGNRDIDFLGKAIIVRSTDQNDPDIVAATIIDCNGAALESYMGFYFNNDESPDSVLAGLTITNAAGGGIATTDGSSPTITNCIITRNVGGMYNDWYSSPVVANCTFTENYADGDGAGMHNSWYASPAVTNCTFTGNYADRDGGGMHNSWYSSPVVTDSTFADNYAYGDGSGMHNSWYTDPVVTNCIFTGNSTAGDGAGMYNSLYSTPVVINCTFAGNYADGYGAGMYNSQDCDLTLVNCTLTGNFAHGYGGGISNTQSSATLVNCTFSANQAFLGGGIHSAAFPGYPGGVTLTNCVLWHDKPTEVFAFFSVPAISYSDVESGWPGEGNIEADPCFIEAGYWADANDSNIVVGPDDPNAVWIEGNYHLLPTSPCIDAGNNDSVVADTHDIDGDGNETEPIPWDIDAKPRFIDHPNVPDTGSGAPPIIDMGAYETPPPIELPLKFTPQALNPLSAGNWLKAHFVLPESFTVGDVDTNTPITLNFLGARIESAYINAFLNEDGLVEIESAFARAALRDTAKYSGSTSTTVVVEGLLTKGRFFYGTDTIKIINKNLDHLAHLATHWLRTDCSPPDWCNGLDLNHDSVVNFIDLALFDGCCIEIITE